MSTTGDNLYNTMCRGSNTNTKISKDATQQSSMIYEDSICVHMYQQVKNVIRVDIQAMYMQINIIEDIDLTVHQDGRDTTSILMNKVKKATIEFTFKQRSQNFKIEILQNHLHPIQTHTKDEL